MTNKCDAFPGHQRDPSIKKIARNTWKYTNLVGETCIKLHYTNVVRELPNGQTILNSNGWQTTTTKDRMNCNSRGLVVIQKKHRWYVRSGGWNDPEAVTVAFYDGITLPDAFKTEPQIKGIG